MVDPRSLRETMLTARDRLVIVRRTFGCLMTLGTGEHFWIYAAKKYSV